MKIADYILQYFEEHSYLVLPKMGVLILQNVSANHAVDKGVIKAPSSHLLFNYSKQIEDASFYLFVKDVLNISFDEAKQQIDQAIVDLQKALEDKKQVNWPNLGVWSKLNDSIHFDFHSHIQLNHHYFGLNDIFIASKEQLHTLQINALEQQENKSETARRFSLSIPGAAAVFFGAISLGYWMANYAPNFNDTYENLNVIDTSSFANMKQNTERFYIVYKSFSEAENAQKCAQELNDQNISASILNEDGLFKVYLSEHHNIFDAKDTLDIWQKLNAKVWIYKGK